MNAMSESQREVVWCRYCIENAEGEEHHKLATYVVVDISDPEDPIAIVACDACAELQVSDANNPDVYAFMLPCGNNTNGALCRRDFENRRT
jgi:hypothetical protein